VQVSEIRWIRRDSQCNTFDDLYAVSLEGTALFRIIGEKPHLRDSEVPQNRGRGGILPAIDWQAKRNIGVNSIHPSILQSVSFNLVRQPDSATFLTEIQHETPALRGNQFQGSRQLLPTIAPKRSQSIACQALGMKADERRLASGVISLCHGDELNRRALDLEGLDGKPAVFGRKIR
jgi:hypothetical protein